jgi:hypothetical protein
MISIHDNETYAYVVDICGRRITLHTEHPTTRQCVDVIFDEVAAFQIAEVDMRQNVLLDIIEVEPAQLFSEFSSLLGPMKLEALSTATLGCHFVTPPSMAFMRAFASAGYCAIS